MSADYKISYDTKLKLELSNDYPEDRRKTEESSKDFALSAQIILFKSCW